MVTAIISALLAVMLLCTGCSESYVNDLYGLYGGESAAEDDTASYAGEDGSADISGNGGNTDISDVFISAGSGDIGVISSDDIESIGVPVERLERDETAVSSERVPAVINNSDVAFDESKFAYFTLNAHERQVYVEMYRIILAHKAEVTLSSLDMDEIDKCFNCVMIDNPGFFYIDGYRMTRTTVDGKLKSISFAPRYTMNEKEVLAAEDEIDAYVNKFITSMPDYADEYSKAKYIFDYIVDNTEYDVESENSQNICSVFINGKSVCQGYSMAVKYLADELKICCTVVYGDAAGESHAWNLMRLDGVYCHVDATWGDTSYRNRNDDSTEAMKDYVFFGATDQIISSNHTVDHITDLPECISLDSYYFVREGRYFTSFDTAKLDDEFDEAYEAGENMLTIRFSDSSVYDEYDMYLFVKENVFDFLQGTSKARYVRNRDELTISFLLV